MLLSWILSQFILLLHYPREKNFKTFLNFKRVIKYSRFLKIILNKFSDFKYFCLLDYCITSAIKSSDKKSHLWRFSGRVSIIYATGDKGYLWIRDADRLNTGDDQFSLTRTVSWTSQRKGAGAGYIPAYKNVFHQCFGVFVFLSDCQSPLHFLKRCFYVQRERKRTSNQ